jgi:hypothetical protein
MNRLSEYLQRNEVAFASMIATFSLSGFALIAANRGWNDALFSASFGYVVYALLWVLGLRFRPVQHHPGRQPVAILAVFTPVLLIALALYVYEQPKDFRFDLLHTLSMTLLYVPVMLWLFEAKTETQP